MHGQTIKSALKVISNIQGSKNIFYIYIPKSTDKNIQQVLF